MISLTEMAEDIRTMRVRGAGKIARHAVQALAAWDASSGNEDPEAYERGFAEAVRTLLATRPSAVSLRNGLRFVEARVQEAPDLPAKRAALRAAVDEFVHRSKTAVEGIGRTARGLLREGGTYFTICNSQAAIAGFLQGRRDGLDFQVYAPETRPWRQGFLTSAQLAEGGVPVTIVVDSAAFGLVRDADAVFVGCDTIAANGDVVNKVGTNMLATAAREHGIPFYVCGESYKVDLEAPDGAAVRIEERDPQEILEGRTLPAGVHVYNPVFDVTPHRLVTRILMELGALAPGEVAAAARKAWQG